MLSQSQTGWIIKQCQIYDAPRSLFLWINWRLYNGVVFHMMRLIHRSHSMTLPLLLLVDNFFMARVVFVRMSSK